MRNPLERRYGEGDLHFITFSCIYRRPLLGNAQARDTFVQVLSEVRVRYAFRLIGHVVMPEHVHLMITEPAKGDPSKVLQVLKQRVSGQLLEKVRGEDPRSEPHFWMRRFYDFNVWSGEKITEKLNYMHLNPITRGLVAHPRNWPWSSWSHYANKEKGLIGIDRWDTPHDSAENPHP